MRYFWWAEFQRRGAIHYHLMLVDAPFADEPEAKRWLTKAWTSVDGAVLADIQAWTKIRSAAWFRQSGADYVMKDARKGHRKAYEQEYSRMPRNWRTFRSNQLTFTAAAHQEHETRAWTVCTATPDAPWYEKQRAIWIERVDHHCPQDGGCRLTERRKRRQPATTQGAVATSGGENSRERAATVSGGLKFCHRQDPRPQPVAAAAGVYPTGTTERMHDITRHRNAAVSTSGASNELPSCGGLPASGGPHA